MHKVGYNTGCLRETAHRIMREHAGRRINFAASEQGIEALILTVAGVRLLQEQETLSWRQVAYQGRERPCLPVHAKQSERPQGGPTKMHKRHLMGGSGGGTAVAASNHGTMKDPGTPVPTLLTDKGWMKETEKEWKHTLARWKRRTLGG